MNEADETAVAIIGGGVVGLSAAVALSRQGVRVVVYERDSAPNHHPRAHVANPRTLEIFRLWGVERDVRTAGLPERATGHFVWLTSITGSPLGEISYDASADHLALRQAATLTPEVSCAQDVIESILRRRLIELTGKDVRYDAPVTAVREAQDGVVLTVAGRREPVRARYAIAADGAGSRTRRALGIPMKGPDELGRFISIYLHADLSAWTGDVPAVLYWIVNSRVQGVFISMDGRSRYVFHVRIDPRHERFEDYTTDRCRQLLHDAIGVSAEIDIREVGQWVMSGQVAERYRAGRVILTGDAAHRFPPTGGFGMNTGIQDAHNLAWKLAGVLRGWAPESLLDSYEAERQPVAATNCARSVANFLGLADLASWSLDSRQLIERLESDGEPGRAERARFTAGVERQRTHFDKLDQELGFVYEDGALAHRTSSASVPSSAAADNPQPITRAIVGARAPLVRLTTRDGEIAATTDLFEREFVLLANASQDWQRATQKIADAGVPIRHLVIGHDLNDPDGRWPAVSGTEPGGAILVRPDGHVAYRASTLPESPTESLHRAMTTILTGEDEL